MKTDNGHNNGKSTHSMSETQLLQLQQLEDVCTQLLTVMGQDTQSEALLDTPRRFARAWWEFMHYSSGTLDTAFEAVQTDQLVLVTGMRVWSMCAHHLLPFYADITIGYMTESHVLGLSKFARIAHAAAHALQTQEQLTASIADGVQAYALTQHVAVLATGQHTCMMMRGIKTAGTMACSVMRGAFRTDSALRAEFMQLQQHAAASKL